MFIYITAIPSLPLPSLTPYFYSFTSVATHFHFPPFFHCFPPPSFYFCRFPHPPISSPTYVFGFSSLYSSSSSSITTTCALSTSHLPFTDLTSAPSTLDEVEIELPWPGYTTLLMLKEERLNQSQY